MLCWLRQPGGLRLRGRWAFRLPASPRIRWAFSFGETFSCVGHRLCWVAMISGFLRRRECGAVRSGLIGFLGRGQCIHNFACSPTSRTEFQHLLMLRRQTTGIMWGVFVKRNDVEAIGVAVEVELRSVRQLLLDVTVKPCSLLRRWIWRDST